MVQHQFANMRDEVVWEEEKKIFGWQKEGIGIDSSAIGLIANITVLVGERILWEKLERKGYKLKMYKVYINDIFAIVWGVGRERPRGRKKNIERIEWVR